jgi:hypothetical protein
MRPVLFYIVMNCINVGMFAVRFIFCNVVINSPSACGVLRQLFNKVREIQKHLQASPRSSSNSSDYSENGKFAPVFKYHVLKTNV